MRAELFFAGLILTTMIFSPCLAGKSTASPIPPSADFADTSKEITVKVLNVYDNSTFDVPMEEYLLGVVLGEMPASFEGEALKAQSVAARTYTVDKMQNPSHENADVCMAASCCQAYVYPTLYDGGEDNLLKVKNAVDETKGEIMTYKSEPVLAVFHAMSAGKTEDAENVWGNAVPYLKSAESKGEETVDRFETTYTISFSEFCRIVNSSVSSPSDIKAPTLSKAGYVKTIEIGNRTFTGSEIRSLFSLRSSAFSIKADENLVTFTVKGYGHGVGMSQHGANVLAKDGWDYKKILTHYYTGVDIELINN